ncbi:hypothetical protein LPJ78_004620 [Coemansia sp. RSA 989]|nr:histidine phosphatase superfamily [Coemansia mojavensis]KAJ1741336.1 hypothetical protein LPJ68_002938 [Coemansia sp. RSA 1086]KAJ1749574.1 hypothetical protein LPJ79_003612 [Coemansia sp. RSA 1821]KAJ1862602.1 hypothetical protein LPJ78_004620 [Coemansia sp. RSA 989]KAJ1871556.1 hypothetical protein LPJ55_003798 [Coemansia sp. RSA 990]KAJ2630316.1 hypothetical protein H4R22_002750 [Coemansia sp. RSA 1290]KAJ2646908.1 hypothetical protein IWW40_005081 [Coemansia sp. RSA 1250]KAJ2668736.1 
MEEIPLPVGCITCYFVRHGERIDHIDETWIQKAPVPYDPPLTAEGLLQAQRTGALISDLESTLEPAEYLVLTSPFLRCLQTAQGIQQGYMQNRAGNWKIAIEPGLSEVMNENYFDHPLPDTLISWRERDLDGCANMQADREYKRIKETLPEYPENFQSMMARFVATLDMATARQLGLLAAQNAVQPERPAKRRVLIMVTHGAGISSLLWATTKQPGAYDVPYCCLTRAQLVSRLSSQPLAPFGSTRIPAFKWNVDYRAYSQHTANL